MKTPWYAKPLGDGMMAYQPIGEIEALFEPAFADAGRPRDMAAFTRHVLEGTLHCEVTAYFSPAAAPVARAVDATPCNKPDPSDLALLAGDRNCWTVLFEPER